jgi:four helix bundle protein
MRIAATAAMANDFTELVAWQRADELEKFMLEVIKRPSSARDREFCKQTSDAAGSAPRNIAEGFGRFAPIQFANFLRIAIGSEQETKNQILKAWQRGAITDEERNAGLLLARRAVSAATGLRRYNLSPQARANAKKIEDACARWADDETVGEPGDAPDDLEPNEP